MTGPALDMLVISDLHMDTLQDRPADVLRGPLFLRKACGRLDVLGVRPQVLILLGDFVEDGQAPGAESALAELAAEAAGMNVRVLAVPGNHDGDPQRVAERFGCGPGYHAVSGVGFLVFHDRVGRGDITERPGKQVGAAFRTAQAHPGTPLIALQHNPLHPPIHDEYPYLLRNADEVLDDYRRAGALLSLSGHYHRGQAAHRVDGLMCYTVPAACETPYRFAHVSIRQRRVTVTEHALQQEKPYLIDTHCHTEFAYCGTSVHAEQNINIGRALGLAGLCLTEHAFQLYLDPQAAWSWQWQEQRDVLEQSWRSGRGRMPAYRALARSLGSEFVYAGLELDLCADGSLALAEQDRSGWDLLLGHIHRIPDLERGNEAQTAVEARFLEEVERMLAHRLIDVLAHPFRFFKRRGLDTPVALYEPVAHRLAESHTAAEINLHECSASDTGFIEACLAHGVKIALGSDAHALEHVGELTPHLALLRRAGVADRDLPSVLYRPARAAGFKSRA